jgi:hypothetical protein
MTWASVATLDSPTAGTFIFTSLDLSTYAAIEIRCAGIHVTTDGTDVRLTFYVGGGEITGTAYRWTVGQQSTSASSNADQATGAASILLMADTANWDVGSAAAESFGCTILVPNPSSSALHKRVVYESVQIGPTGNAIGGHGAGAIDGIKIGGTSSLTAGKVRILGLEP